MNRGEPQQAVKIAQDEAVDVHVYLHGLHTRTAVLATISKDVDSLFPGVHDEDCEDAELENFRLRFATTLMESFFHVVDLLCSFIAEY